MKRKTYLLVFDSFSKASLSKGKKTTDNGRKYLEILLRQASITIVMAYEYENVSCLNEEYYNTLILCVEVSGARRVPNIIYIHITVSCLVFYFYTVELSKQF